MLSWNKPMVGDEPRWNELFGQGWRFLLDDVPDKDFPTRFLSEENFDRLKRIREELGIAPVDVMQLCLDAAPSGVNRARALRDVAKDARWLFEKVLPRLTGILEYLSEPHLLRSDEQRKLVNRWPRQPRAKIPASEPVTNDPISVLEAIREALRHPQPPNRDPTLPKSPLKIPRAYVVGRLPLLPSRRVREAIDTLREIVWVLVDRGRFLAAPPKRESNEAKRFFFENWESRTVRLRGVVKRLDDRAVAARREREQEETSIGGGKPTELWEQLTQRERRAIARRTKWQDVLQRERRVRAEYGTGLYFVIFDSPIGADAYGKRVVRLLTTAAAT